jgi:dTDP-4-dehydrorhamnose 3,5-epimerase
MRFTETALAGAFVIEFECHRDERGYFARSWCQREFAQHGLDTALVQCNVSHNTRAGTLRGMHFQVAPHAEVKLVRCTRGALFDVIVDLRPASPTFKQHVGYELTEANGTALYVPKGFAHGYLTLHDETDVLYQVTEFFAPDAAGGVRWNDPAFGIAWPAEVRVISARDATYPDFTS